MAKDSASTRKSIPNLDRVLSRLRQLPEPLSEETAWIVLTGSPSAGKSTLLEELRLKGHSTHQEQAREFFERELRSGATMKALVADPGRLVQRIFEKNLQTHKGTSRRQVTVFDRGLPDVLAFGLMDHVDVEPYIEQCGKFRFATALVFEQVPAHPDRLVYHSHSQLLEIENACAEIYKALGANVKKLPAFSNDRYASATKRLDIVEQEIRHVAQTRNILSDGGAP